MNFANPLGGGGIVQIAAQQPGRPAVVPPVPPPGLPPQSEVRPAIRRPGRSILVEAGPPKLDRLGDPLPPGAIARFGSVRLRHGQEPLGLGFSYDGKMLGSIAATADAIRLWDVATGKELHRLEMTATLAAFARDGSILVVDENRVKVWIPAGNTVRDLPEKTLDENPQAVAVHPDGRSFVVGLSQKLLQIDIQTGKPLRELNYPPGQSGMRLVFSPDGRWLAGAGQKTGVWLWDLRSGKRVRTYRSDFDLPEFTFSPDGGRIVIMADKMQVFSCDSEEPIDEFKAPEIVLQNPRFSKDGNLIFGLTADGNFYQVNAKTGEASPTDGSLDAGIRPPMAIAPDGVLAAGADESGGIHIWDPKSGKEVEVDRLPPLHDPGFSRDGKTVFCLASDGRIHGFETATGKKLSTIELPVDEESQLTWDPRSRRAIAVSAASAAAGMNGADLEILILNVDSQQVLHKISLPNFGVVPVIQFCSGDRNRAVVLSPGLVSIINLSTGSIVRSLKIGRPEEQPLRGAISPDGRLVAAATRPLTVWEVSTGKKRLQLDALMMCAGAVFSPDGRHLAAWDAVGNIFVLDVRLGTVVRRMQASDAENPELVLAFSADGKLLAAGDQDGGVLVWDLATGDTLAVFDRHEAGVAGLAFSPDSRLLVSTSLDGTSLVWRIPSTPQSRGAEPPLGGFDEAFKLLASSDPTHAQRAMEYLYRRPADAVKFCSEQITAPRETPAAKIAGLVADLGSEDFPVRQAAVKDLEAIGGEAMAALREAAEKSPSPEVRKLANEVIGRFENAAPKSEDLRLLRIVEVLEGIGSPEARSLLSKWAGGPRGHRMTSEAAAALERLNERGK
jgi:WD40 repeat protein